jgi:sodium/bile acid cotransporter 7
VRVRIDPFVVALLTAALLASFVPATGVVLEVLKNVSLVAIGLLFFLYGARLSTPETLAGLRNWRLHAAILATTFVVFPLLGLSTQLLEPVLLTPVLASGVLLMCFMPSSIQSPIVYTRIAGGNVAGAVVSASLSNLIGVFLTPFLMTTQTSVGVNSIVRIVLQLFVPFVLGQVLRPALGASVARHDRKHRFDRGCIVLVVFVAFSEGAEADIWSSVSVWSVLTVAALCLLLLLLTVGWAWGVGRTLAFTRSDRIPLLFCGYNKSLASGLPIVSVLFAGGNVALLVLPLMIYHQFQIITGAMIATRLARRAP